VTASYTYVRSSELDDSQRLDTPLTPRHSFGLTGMWESQKGRIGVESYDTGRHRLEENPHRSESKPHVLFGFLVEVKSARCASF
jgi:outer membrane receptor for ferrienterochelin and colicins